MGRATGKTFEEWLEKLGTLWAFLNQDRIRVTGRNGEDTGTTATFTKKNGGLVIFTVLDSVHSYANPTGQDDFRRYALLIGAFLAQGGLIEDVSDPFHDED